MENGETPQLTPKWEDNYKYNRQLSTSRCIKIVSSYSSSSLSLTSRSTDQSYCSRKLGTLSDPVTTRSAKHACGKPMQTNPEKPASGSRGSAHIEDETDKEDPTQGFPDWLQPFTVDLEDLEAQCSHIPLKERTQIRKVMLQKCRHKKTEAQCSCLLPQQPTEINSASR